MKIRTLMRTQLVTARPDDGWGVAARLMVRAGIRHLPVVADGHVVGIVTEHDVLEQRAAGKTTAPLSTRLSRPVQTAHPDEDVVEVAARMAQTRVDCLPVVEVGKLVGLVTATDLLNHIVEDAFEPAPKGRRVGDVMTPNPEVARLDDLLLDVAGRMSHRSIRHLPIVDGDRHVIGIVSDRDLRTATGELLSSIDEKTARVRLQLQRVSDVARSKPITVRDDTPVTQATRLIVEHRIGALPVVDAQDRLIGIVSYLDILSRGNGSQR